ncbi:helicase-exonuclease AddAB subunit AddA, partial [Staphylococcus coagulans]|nr:helicase-exonuclease AddAB subunit AddA [Staphylococcus coagulans]
ELADKDESLRPSVSLNYIKAEDILPVEETDDTAQKRSIETLKNRLALEPTQQSTQQSTLELIEAQLLYEYPHRKATQHASKQSVSELKRLMETEQANTSYDRVRQYQLGVATYDRPSFMQEDRLTPTEIGTLMHTVMQHLPFQAEGLTDDELDAYFDKLVVHSIIKAEDIRYIRKSEIRD